MYDAMDEIVTHRGYGNNVAKYKKYENLLSQHCRDSLCRLIEGHRLPRYFWSKSDDGMIFFLTSIELGEACSLQGAPSSRYGIQIPGLESVKTVFD